LNRGDNVIGMNHRISLGLIANNVFNQHVVSINLGKPRRTNEQIGHRKAVSLVILKAGIRTEGAVCDVGKTFRVTKKAIVQKIEPFLLTGPHFQAMTETFFRTETELEWRRDQ